MLTLLAPYILGILTQVGSVIGQKFVDPTAGASTAQEAADRKVRFGRDVDTAQMLPSVITVIGVTLAVSPKLGRDLTAITIVAARLLYASLQAWIARKTPVEYDHLTRRLPFNLSPVNAGVIAVYVALGAIVAYAKR